MMAIDKTQLKCKTAQTAHVLIADNEHQSWRVCAVHSLPTAIYTQLEADSRRNNKTI